MRACAAALTALVLAACGAKDESGGRGTTTKAGPDANTIMPPLETSIMHTAPRRPTKQDSAIACT